MLWASQILPSWFLIPELSKNDLYAMFAFWQGSVHVFKDVSYGDDNIILSFVY
jgi:hypothetical protein